MNELPREWLTWAKSTVAKLRHGGYLVYPDNGAIFKLDKENHTVTVVCEKPEWHGSDTEKKHDAVFRAIGYEPIRNEPVPTDPEGYLKTIHEDSLPFDLMACISQLFKMQKAQIEQVWEQTHRKTLHQAAGKKEPINPVTIRGPEGNLSIGRLWMNKFGQDPARSALTEKSLTLVAWSGSEDDPQYDATLVGDENTFINCIKALRSAELAGAVFNANGRQTTAPEGDTGFQSVYFQRSGDVLTVNFRRATPATVTFNLSYPKFIEGLDHLFVLGELRLGEN